MASPLGPLRLVGEALRAFAAKHPDLFALGRKDLELPKYPVPDAEPTQDYLARLAGSGGLDYIGRRYERPGGQHFQLNDRAIPTFGMTYTAADLNAIRKTGVTPMTIMSRIHDRPTVETVFPGMKTYDIDASSASAPGVPALGVQSYYPLWDVLEHVGGINHTSGLTSDNLVRKPQALQSYMMRGNSGDQVAGSDEFFQELGSHPIDRDLRRHFLAADPGDDYGTDIAYARQFKRMSPAERIGALAAANRASLEARLRMSIGQDPATDRLLSQSQWPMSRPAFADTVTPNLTNKVDQEMGGVWRMGGTSRKRALLHDWLLNRAYEGQPVDAGQLDQAYRDFPQFFQGLYFKRGGSVGGLNAMRKCGCE